MVYLYQVHHLIMNKKEIKQLCEDIQKYYIDRICDLCEDGKVEDATSLYEEINEWLIEKDRPKILTLKLKQNDKT